MKLIFHKGRGEFYFGILEDDEGTLYVQYKNQTQEIDGMDPFLVPLLVKDMQNAGVSKARVAQFIAQCGV